MVNFHAFYVLWLDFVWDVVKGNNGFAGRVFYRNFLRHRGRVFPLNHILLGVSLRNTLHRAYSSAFLLRLEQVDLSHLPLDFLFWLAVILAFVVVGVLCQPQKVLFRRPRFLLKYKSVEEKVHTLEIFLTHSRRIPKFQKLLVRNDFSFRFGVSIRIAAWKTSGRLILRIRPLGTASFIDFWAHKF